MEATFYEDSRYRIKDDMRPLKRPMTLDLDQKSSKKSRANTLLTSPDLNMLKLGSPELEKLIIAQHTNFGAQNPCMYKTDDRDLQQYSRDFNDALSTLQQVASNNSNGMSASLYPQTLQTDMSMVNNSQNCGIMPPSSMPCSTTPMVDSYGYHQQPLASINMNSNPMVSSSMNSNPMVSSSMNSNCYMPNGYYNHEPMVSIKEEPQTVPCMGGSPPQSPIDMEDQERLKLERKRLRNRIAASKCRRRKLERIARLEDKVAILKNENGELQNVVTRLRGQVCQLKQQVLDHVRSGCEILVSSYNTDL